MEDITQPTINTSANQQAIVQPTYPVTPNVVNQPTSVQSTYPVTPRIVTINNTSRSQSPYQGYNNFSGWQADFTNRASAMGYNRNDIQRLLRQAQYKASVVSLDNNQAEFVKMPWEYVEKAVSVAKILKGREKFSANSGLFSQIQQRYQIDPYIVAAIWGMESSFGAGTGNINLASSLSSLAYDGRRRDFAEKQLLSLLTLLQRGDVNWSHIKGSWAGGMGHTQFIPATWLSQGVDGDRDGRRNPWSAKDALSSTANYLHNSGWVAGLPPFIEVRLPRNFDYSNVGKKMPLAYWQNLGLHTIGGFADSSVPMTLWLPAGENGPALLTTKNFDVIKVYNNSSNYALAVSLLAKEIAYQGSLYQPWPKYEKPLSKYQVKQLQQKLTSMGYDTKGVDGVVGTNTRKAFQRWQMSVGKTADGFICQRTASSLLY
ncbi:MAG: lytic murein transglycosylase [Moraxellaceae bacterium]|nr:lytic murein transglycosylase [Moraxellaceae bacterium]